MTYSKKETESEEAVDEWVELAAKGNLESFKNYVIGALLALVVGSGLLFVVKKLDLVGGNSSGMNVVLFDSNKYVISKRTAAAEFIQGGTPWRINGLNEKVDDEVKALLRTIAGEAIILDASVVILSEGYIDITNQVLEELGLPTEGLSGVDASNLGKETVSSGQRNKEVKSRKAIEKEENFMEMLP